MEREKDMECLSSIKNVMDIFGGKWSFLILEELRAGEKRFNQLNKSLNISTKSLTDSLKHLESNGIIHRKVLPTVPITVLYSLTEKGESFDVVLDSMKSWAQTWI